MFCAVEFATEVLYLMYQSIGQFNCCIAIDGATEVIWPETVFRVQIIAPHFSPLQLNPLVLQYPWIPASAGCVFCSK